MGQVWPQSSFDIRALQVFVTTAEQGGMTNGAQVLGMTQSGVSQTISGLEDTVGQQLFDRSVRPIALTAAGRSLYSRGKDILTDVRDAYNAVTQGDGDKLSRIAITMPESLANVIGPSLCKRAGHLADSWRISNALFPDQLAHFTSHEADIMIAQDVHASDMLEHERFPILVEPHVLMFPKSFPLEMALGDHLSAAPLIRFSPRCTLARITEAQLARLQLDFAHSAEFDSVRGHAQAIANGQGWGITNPVCLLQTPDLLDQVEVRPIERASFDRRLSMVARKGVLGGATEKLAAECRAILREEVFPALLDRYGWLEGKMSTGED